MHNNLASAGSDDGRDFFMASLIHTEQLMRLKASEPRDKIFALRALSARTLGKIPVDYERPAGVLFAEVTKELIKTHKNPELLYFAGISKVVRGTGREPMPSWAVDFGVANGCFLFLFNPIIIDLSRRAQSIHDDIMLQFRFWKDSQRLSLMGAQIGAVGEFVSHGLYRRFIDGAWVDQYGNVVQEPLNNFISSVSSAVESDQRLDRLMGNSVQKMLREICAAPDQGINASGIPAEMLDRGLATSFEPWYEQDQLYATYETMIYGYHTCPLFTSNGMSGVGLVGVREGDVVCLLVGLGHPFVLRPQVSDNGTRYEIVGPAIIGGAMKGHMWPDEDELEKFVII